jgi:uncharacterized protein (DUF433 family)
MNPKTVIHDYIIFKDGTARIVGSEHLKAELVARMHVNGERSIDFVMAHYGLTRAQVHAALAYYYENQEVLDAEYEHDWATSQATKSDVFRAELQARLDAMNKDE